MEMELAAARHHGCKVCGKSFSSGRSLGGHMRSHLLPLGDAAAAAAEGDAADEQAVARASENGVVGCGLRENPRKTRRLSDFAGDAEAEMVVLPPAAVTALAAAPRRRRRTMRVAAPPPAPPPPPPPAAPPVPCVFDKEPEPEPEDVALCLLMLSRDTGLWSLPVKQELPRSGSARDSDEAKIKGRVVPKVRRKRRSSPAAQQGGGAVAPPKRTRYECPGCGKVFGSYQALGGHRASHKRINTSCSAAPMAAAAAAPEPSAETYASSSTMSPSASPDSVAVGFGKPNNAQAAAAAAVGNFECPVCFVVFSSGKALGRHKLSHLVLPADGGELYAGGAGQENEQHSAGFLDLNFPPAPPEEA
ncbi:unnamed protein product [Urochloa humidicola]